MGFRRGQSRRGTLLLMFILLIPAAGMFFMLALTHLDVIQRETQRTRLRAQASVRGDVSWRPRTAATQIAEQLQALFALVPDADGDGPACVVSDADLRRSRSAALCGALSQALPQLDFEHDTTRTGVACGELGIAAPLVLLALAAAKAEAESRPTVAMAIAESEGRTFAIVSPPTLPPADADGSTPDTPRAA